MGYRASVIVPVYNDQDGLDRCLTALGKQTVPATDYQVVVVDNLSDRPLQVPRAAGAEVLLLNCAKPGSYAARNLGVKAAQGRVLAFLDADCRPAENWLEEGLRSIASGAKKNCGGDVQFEVAEHPNAIEAYQLLTGFGQQKYIQENLFSTTANLFVLAEVFEQVGPFNEELLSGGDRDWCWRSRAAGFETRFCEKAVVYTRPRSNLGSAIRQVRRVAGGRAGLGEISAHADEQINQERGVGRKIRAILAAPGLSLRLRVRILFLAIFLRLVHDLERIRLRLGRSPERG